MADVTLRVIDGSDRGRVFDDLATPVTIGREEGNSIQLNDERISRFHLKIQEDQSKFILTDLDSTNGTRVNGEETQLRILRFGDVVSLGRSVLLFGSRDQIAQRLKTLRESGIDMPALVEEEDHRLQDSQNLASLDFELQWGENTSLQRTLHTLSPPELPSQMSPGQSAQLSELIEYLHIRIRDLITSVESSGSSERITLPLAQWLTLADVQDRLAQYLRKISEPDPAEPEE